jgi:hypothetical protein
MLSRIAARRSSDELDVVTLMKDQSRAGNALMEEADARIRTADPFITSEVLYQLSYVGAAPKSLGRV